MGVSNRGLAYTISPAALLNILASTLRGAVVIGFGLRVF